MFNVITRKTLLHYSQSYPLAKNAIFEWYYEILISDFKDFNELKLRFPSASLVGDDRVVFNILGNRFRLVVRIVFMYKAVQIKWFGTHSEYDNIDVKTVKFKL